MCTSLQTQDSCITSTMSAPAKNVIIPPHPTPLFQKMWNLQIVTSLSETRHQKHVPLPQYVQRMSRYISWFGIIIAPLSVEFSFRHVLIPSLRASFLPEVPEGCFEFTGPGGFAGKNSGFPYRVPVRHVIFSKSYTICTLKDPGCLDFIYIYIHIYIWGYTISLYSDYSETL